MSAILFIFVRSFVAGRWKSLSVMDQLYDVFKLYADQFAKIPMFPVLQCVHYTIMNLKLRMGEGKFIRRLVQLKLMYRSNWRFNIPPPGHTPGIWLFAVPGE